MSFPCEDCKKEIKMIGKTKHDCLDKAIRHFYDHDYPAWRQPISIEKDMSFEEYKLIFHKYYDEDK